MALERSIDTSVEEPQEELGQLAASEADKPAELVENLPIRVVLNLTLVFLMIGPRPRSPSFGGA